MNGLGRSGMRFWLYSPKWQGLSDVVVLDALLILLDFFFSMFDVCLKRLSLVFSLWLFVILKLNLFKKFISCELVLQKLRRPLKEYEFFSVVVSLVFVPISSVGGSVITSFFSLRHCSTKFKPLHLSFWWKAWYLRCLVSSPKLSKVVSWWQFFHSQNKSFEKNKIIKLIKLVSIYVKLVFGEIENSCRWKSMWFKKLYMQS